MLEATFTREHQEIMTMKKTLAAVALAASSLTGVGAGAMAMAPSAGAAQLWHYGHGSARYSSLAQCNYYHNGVINTIKARGGHVTNSYPCRKSGSTWNYVAVAYMATHPLIAGDWTNEP